MEELSETDAILPPSKWRKDTDGGWRMDVNFMVDDELDDAAEIDVEVDKSMSENND